MCLPMLRLRSCWATRLLPGPRRGSGPRHVPHRRRGPVQIEKFLRQSLKFMALLGRFQDHLGRRLGMRLVTFLCFCGGRGPVCPTDTGQMWMGRVLAQRAGRFLRTCEGCVFCFNAEDRPMGLCPHPLPRRNRKYGVGMVRACVRACACVCMRMCAHTHVWNCCWFPSGCRWMPIQPPAQGFGQCRCCSSPTPTPRRSPCARLWPWLTIHK